MSLETLVPYWLAVLVSTIAYFAIGGIWFSPAFVTGFFDSKKPQPMAWFAVTGSYHLMGLLAASVIVSIWKGA
jgi:phosphatidylglycerophosphatase A